MRFSDAPILKVPADTTQAVMRGHPWVYGPLKRPEAGTPVRLEGPKGEVVGYGLSDEGDIAVRVLGAGAAPARTVGELVRDRIQRANAFRVRLAPPQTNAWRMVNGSGDGLPGLIIDLYAQTAVLKVYSNCWEPHLVDVIEGIRATGWATSLLRRFGVRSVDGRTGHEVRFGTVPDTVIVEEHGMKLLVRPREGQKTGMFIDQREHRHLVRGWAAGRRVANLFAYNGGFSVAAAIGGASRVHTVDIAPAAIEDARENFRLNGLDPDDHVFEVADVFAWKPKGRFGLLIVDPPSLARGKGARVAAEGAYRKLHAGLGGSIERDGLLASSSCTAQLTWDAWLDAVRAGIQRHGTWSVLHQSRAPFDHPVALGHAEGHYLKLALIRLLDAST